MANPDVYSQRGWTKQEVDQMQRYFQRYKKDFDKVFFRPAFSTCTPDVTFIRLSALLNLMIQYAGMIEATLRDFWGDDVPKLTPEEIYDHYTGGFNDYNNFPLSNFLQSKSTKGGEGHV